MSATEIQTAPLRQRTIPHPHVPPATLVLSLAVVQLIAAVFVHCVWLLTRNDAWLRVFFGYASPAFLLAVGFAEIYFAIMVARESSGTLARLAWAFIAASAVSRLIRLSAIHVVTVGFRITPDFVLYHTWFSPDVGARTRLTVLTGPVPMALLVAGLLLFVAARWKSGLWRRPRVLDVLAIAALLGYIAAIHGDVSTWLHARSPDLTRLGTYWVTMPLRALALGLALLLYRQAIQGRDRAEAKCWTAFGAALITAALINVCLWLTWRGYLLWPQNSFAWYLQIPAAAAFALGPIYALESLRRRER